MTPGRDGEHRKMSIEAMTWALTAPLGGNAKVVLLGLANHAHPDGTEARPSVARLARYAHCDERTVQRHLRKLEEDGWIQTVKPGGTGGANGRAVTVYRLNMGRQIVTPPDEGMTSASPGGGAAVAPGATLLSPQPSLEPSIEPSGENAGAREVDADPVDEVWAHYQRTVPNGSRRKLGPTQRRLIKNALKVRSVQECCRAVTALCESDYHVENGYLDVKYALLGGGRSPSPEATIDRWCAKLLADARDSAAAGGSVTGGNGRPSVDYAKYDQHVIREDASS